MNFIDLLKEREQGHVRMQKALENALEDSFISGNAEQFDNSMPRSVSSTIAIAMAFDGLTFATTHGDHTVKVFDFKSGAQIRNFVGHPRTPWTLKYHPIDSNIIASGCLGFQVRVWDIKENVCLNVIVYNQTIISLAFHPRGEFLAVACGMRIEMWEWQIPEESENIIQQATDTNRVLTSRYLKTKEQQVAQGSPYYCRTITHKRNIRAVLFHPSGNYIFAVAPDSPKPNNEDLAHCRLYACEFEALFDLDRPKRWGESLEEIYSLSHSTTPLSAEVEVDTATAIGATSERLNRSNNHSTFRTDQLPSNPGHIHTPTRNNQLPSNRGHIHTPTRTTTVAASTTTTAHTMSYEIDRDDGEGGEFPEDDDTYILPLKLTSCRILIPQIHLYSDGGIDISKDGRFLFTCARVHIPPILTEYQQGFSAQNTGAVLSNTNNFSPNSHPARVVAADREASWNIRSLPLPRSRDNIRGSGNNSGSSIGNITSFIPPSAPVSDTAPPPLFIAHNKRQPPGSKASSFYRAKSNTPSVTMSASSSPVHTLISSAMNMNQYSRGNCSTSTASGSIKNPASGGNNGNSDVCTTAPTNNTGSHQQLPELIGEMSIQDARTIDGVPMVVDMTRCSRPRPVSNPGTASTTYMNANSFPMIPEEIEPPVCTLLMAKEKLLNATALATSGSSSCCSNNDSTSHHPCCSVSAMGPRRTKDFITEVADRRIHTHWKQRMMRMGDRSPAGWMQEDHLCVFELRFLPTGVVLSPTLVNSKCLPGALTKAVTSTRLSATGRYGLIGYGVRVGGEVQDHLRRHAACEVVSVNDEDMRSVAVISDFEDEVNIAQFHPFPGHGIVYGTKRGKVRTFTKS